MSPKPLKRPKNDATSIKIKPRYELRCNSARGRQSSSMMANLYQQNKRMLEKSNILDFLHRPSSGAEKNNTINSKKSQATGTTERITTIE